MDSCCATLKANANPVKLRRGLRNGGTGFWGESMRGSLKRRDLSTQLLKWSKNETSRVAKLKPGVAYSILTSDINRESLVSELHAFTQFRLSLYIYIKDLFLLKIEKHCCINILISDISSTTF